ncbi:MAG: MoaD/ThiS family protein [Aquificaceae bacterium]
MLEVIYFASLKELTGKASEEIEFRGSIKDLRELLINRYQKAADILKSSRFAINFEIVGEEHILEGQEKVAVLPPFSGG